MAYLLYFLILIGFCFLIPRISFFKKSGIEVRLLIIFFLVRALMGALNCYLSYYYFKISDSLNFHNISLTEYHLLITDPVYFIKETFSRYTHYSEGLFDASKSFWKNLSENMIVKPMAILNIFTFRNFYINTLIFNIPVFFGITALYRTIKEVISSDSKLLAIIIFLYPTTLFFTSNIHRDGLILMSLGFLLFSFRAIAGGAGNLKKMLLFIFSFILIFIIRNYLAFLLIPFLFAWWLSARTGLRSFPTFSITLLICGILFFVSKYLFPAADFPQFIVNRLRDFNKIAADSRTYLPITTLTPDLVGFIKTFPLAFKQAFTMPVIWKITSAAEIPFALEVLFLWILFIWKLFKTKGKIIPAHPILVFILFVSVISIIIIGYIVPNLGAIIRYRSVYLLFLLILLFYKDFGQKSRLV